MTVKTMIATKKVFDQRGVLRFPGQEVQFDDKPKKAAPKRGEGRDRGLIDPKNAGKIARSTTVVAAIAPTGPNPTAPQQLPVGSNQVLGGYRGPEGEKLVAEGSEAALEIEEGGAPAVKPAKAAKAAAAKPKVEEKEPEGEKLLD